MRGAAQDYVKVLDAVRVEQSLDNAGEFGTVRCEVGKLVQYEASSCGHPLVNLGEYAFPGGVVDLVEPIELFGGVARQAFPLQAGALLVGQKIEILTSRELLQ